MRPNFMTTQSKPTGFGNPWLQLGLSIACVAIYELLLKRGAADTANLSARWSWTGLTGLASIYVWVAIVFVILSLITWLYVLRYIPLSIAFPISQAVYVLGPLGGWLIFREKIITLRWIAIGIISVGLAR